MPVERQEKKKRTYVAIVLDCSGSMVSMQKETVDAFNEQVKAIRESSKEMDTFVSLVPFSTTVHTPEIWNKEVNQLKELQYNEYKPDGYTAMFDAVGWTVQKLQREVEVQKEDDVGFLIVVISDGEENNSKEFNNESIAELIKKVQATDKWTFTYLGANQDLSVIAKQLGIPALNTFNFNATPNGMLKASIVNVASTSNYFTSRDAGHTSVSNFYEGADKVKEE